MAKMTFIVTGGLGFIGRVLVKKLLERYPDSYIIVLDKMGIGSDPYHFQSPKYGRVEVAKCDISDKDQLGLFACSLTNIDCIFHLAAESHVDRSISNPSAFIESNVVGTFNMLFTFKEKYKKFIHVSTDEVYGSLNPDDAESVETDNLNPSSIYSSSKASSDLIVKSAYHTYKMPVLITRCCNNFGSGQNDEKFIPTIIRTAYHDKPIPVYGDGKNMREWISVDHHAVAVMDLYEKGKIGEIYNIGSGYRIDNLKLVKNILYILNKPESLISFVKDRPGHDICYKLNSNKIREILDLPKYDDQTFLSLLKQTVDYYVQNFK
jgi:dTDP-glucose 4,6-dehydratase